ncbi:MAG: hypothetical protein A2808_03255 [Candidatus Moranbacteria bacterium RIFCSPHIGHO2_01_FULL_55_24]|nr:MAG: hypothetical protein A2808_03255 [Candidatus Moranbacteria bacterium RIFCSPHIGHO2_01_FULL_55_24]
MRIGIDVRCLTEGRRTGVEEYTEKLLRELFSLDQENEYVLFLNSWHETAGDFAWLEAFPRVTLCRFRYPNKLLNLCLWYLGRPYLDRLLGGVDVFFVPNQNFVRVSPGVPLVVTAHDLSFELFPETFSWKQRLWHFLVNFRGLARRAARIIAVSQSTAGDLQEYYGVPEEKITVVLSGKDETCQPMDRNSLTLLDVQKRYRLPYRFILSFGTFEPRKNTLMLVEAFEELRRSGGEAAKYDLVLAGSPGWGSEGLYARIEASPFRENIRVLGFVPDEDKAALYNLASLFVYPSLYEGFGFPPLEAMASGVPVIASHASSIPEIVSDAALLVDPYQPNELLLALQAVLTDRELSERLKARGLARAARFSWKRSAEETLRVLTEAGKGS